MSQHRLLQRQIQKHLPPELQQHPDLQAFLDAIDSSYKSYDKDIDLSGHAFNMSELEFRKVNEQLSKEVEQRKRSIQKLRDTIIALGDAHLDHDEHNDDILNITEYLTEQLNKRKEAEDKSLKSVHLISSLLEHLQTGIMFENEYGNIVLTNQTFCKMMGIESPSSIIGVHGAAFTEQVKHLFKDPVAYTRSIDHLLAGNTIEKELVMELANGSIYELDYIPINGAYKGLLWKYRDITDKHTAEIRLRLQEEKYRSILANMNLGLIEVDLEERIRFVNQSFCNMSGYTQEELLGTVASDILLNNEETKALMQEKNKEREAGISDSYEMYVTTKQQQPRWWLISGAPLYNSSKEHVGSIGIHLDITKQKKLEHELKEAKIMAERSAKAQETFLTNMSHEIRTPMNAIMGMGRQLLKTSLSDVQRSYLKAINTASGNLLVIINDILDFSKIEAGKMIIERIGFNLQSLIENTLQIITYKVEDKGLCLAADIDKSMAPVLIGDPYRINQVLINLLSNAIKFTEKGNISVSCKVTHQTADSQQIQLVVKDTGVGIEPDFLKKIFSKFSQEDESIVRKYGGTGLGMSICKELMELMGGAIQVSSQKGVGTQVTVTLNLPIGNAGDIPDQMHAGIDSGILRNKVILLVEDNEMNRLVATTVLSNYGVQIKEAHHGAEAVQYLKNNRVDLVLMDVRMPVMDGFEATSIIREGIDKTVPIIALTANTVKGEQEKCLRAGMNDYVSKPFNEEEFVHTIAVWLGKRFEMDEMENKLPLTNNVKNLYSLNKLQALGGNNEVFIHKMLSIFKIEAAKAITTIKEAYATGNPAPIREVAHRIKPTIHTLCIDAITHDIETLEKVTSDELSGIYPHIEKVEKTLNAVIQDIRLPE